MNSAQTKETWRESRLSLWVFFVAAIYFLLQMLTATRYGYFRDALYYLACSEHLDWGYVDQPPLIAGLGWVARHTLGTSLPALLFWPALAGAARIVLTAAFARELGAGRFGTVLAALLGAAPAVWYILDHQFAMNALEPVFWTGCAYVILGMIKTGNLKLWLAFGALAGLGLENKYSIAVFGFGLLAGLLLTPQRKLLLTPWLFAGGVVALLIFLPNLLWNIHHHWPFLELMHNIRASGKDVALSPLAFLGQQILIMGPLTFPFWLTGLIFYLFSRDAKPFRAFGWAFAITIAFFLMAHGKNYYSAPVYIIVLAGGAVAAERLLSAPLFDRRPRLRAILKPLAFAWLIAGVLLVLPAFLPVLPIEGYLRFQEHLPFTIPRAEHSHMGAALPQYYADEFNWLEMVQAVARVYHTLTPEEQAKTAIFTDNYGEAAAVDFWGAKYGLPKAICGHQNYFLWGPRNYTGEIVIRVGAAIDDVKSGYETVAVAATIENPYALYYETRPILLCRGRKESYQTHWGSVKKWE
jgi:4-amino-4-deoxy-L-arabinose transferase-like glycosyltransferase